MNDHPAKSPEALAISRVMLFDFDGPLCDVFAGMPAREIARHLTEVLGESVNTDDPLEVLSRAAKAGPGATRRVEDALIAAEIDAVGCSKATPGGLESIHACLDSGLSVGIVSNNSRAAILRFLNERGEPYNKVSPIVGRTYLHPELMKPNVAPMKQALQLAGCSPEDAAFIGDSRTDIDVANAVGVSAIAYANKPGKRDVFSALGAAVIDSMWEVELAVRAARARG